jgi:hypothetical protein
MSNNTRLEILASLVADGPISRRQLLPNLLAAITLGRLGLAGALPPMGGNSTDCGIEYAPIQPPPYGPAERTVVIDRWISRVDEALITLEKYYSFLIEARGLAPKAVDGIRLVNLENEVHAICDGIVGYIDCDYENDLISSTTGRSSSAVCVEAELNSDSHVFDRDFWQKEVDAVSNDHPNERTRLQAALNAKYVGVK